MTTISSLDLQEVARRYGKALLELAVEQNQLEALQAEAGVMIQLLQQVQELQDVVSSPLYSDAEQETMISSVLKKLDFSPLFDQFVMSLCKNRRMMVLHGSLQAFLELAMEHLNIKVVYVRTARVLDQKQYQSLTQSLETQLKQKVKVEPIIDPSVKGGISIEVDSIMVDNTLQSKLNRYQQAMKGII